jgi:peptidoglycan hydrolase-like protein with peptidoglycan-binding domain
MSVHSRYDYAGGLFGRPNSPLLSKSWRLQHNVLGAAGKASLALGGTETLDGEDAINVASLQAGLGVYAGYAYGTYDNWAALVKRFGTTAHLVSIAPVVEKSSWVMCLDIEPGNATPADAPEFMKLPDHGGALRPIFYCSAGDAQTVINTLDAAGYARDTYDLWLAHWLGREHICAPAVCGYPQADATQWASNLDYDSDTWSASVFSGPPSATPTLQLTTPNTVDPVDGVDAVYNLQRRLNDWQPTVGTYAWLNEDGDFGPSTEAAVKAFQTHHWGAGSAQVDGVVGPLTWAAVNAAPPPPPPLLYGPPTALETAVVTPPTVTVNLTWAEPEPVAGLPASQYEVFLYRGAAADRAHLVAGFPKPVSGLKTQVVIAPGSAYIAHVVACGPGGAHEKPDTFAARSFTV